MTHNMYNVDAGDNALRAIYDSARDIIAFICRYKHDQAFYERIIISLATKYDIEIGMLS
jgi:hypothetical protein